MFTVKVNLDDTKLQEFIYGISKAATKFALNRMNKEATATAREMETNVRADISAAGDFGSRWTDAFNVAVGQDGKNVYLQATMDIPYWRVFEYGAIIVGKPLLYFHPGEGFNLANLESKGNFSMNPEVISVHQVTIPKKFHINEIIAQSTKDLSHRLTRGK